MAPDQFIHLRVHSAYSLSEGAIKLKTLIKQCHHYHMPAVAVTDTNNLFGAMEFSITALQSGIQPIIGCQLTLDSIAIKDKATQIQRRNSSDSLVLLVQTEQGYRNLIKLVSMAYHAVERPGVLPCVSLDDLADHTEGLIALTGGISGPIGHLLADGHYSAAQQTLKQLKSLFPERLYIELMRHPDRTHSKHSDLGRTEDTIEPLLIDLAYTFNIPLVATNDCFFLEAQAFEAHDVLLCIGEKRYVSESDRRRVSPDHWFKSPQEMCALFDDLPEAIINTLVIAKRCSFVLKPIGPILPQFPVPDNHSEAEELYIQATAGLKRQLERYVFVSDIDQEEQERRSKPYWQRLEYEYKIILSTDFSGYFLIVSDFMKWTRNQGIPVGIRGSGSMSLIAWCLEITSIDPLHFDLAFERFLNPERITMPDFDIDFCRERRDEVIHYVADKYGHDRVAHIITFSTFQLRIVVRDVGRVLQLPSGLIKEICKQLPESMIHPPSLQEVINNNSTLQAKQSTDPTVAQLLSIALTLDGLYRNISTHAAGIVIGNQALDELIPLYRDPSSLLPVTQFNMKSVEQSGLIKFDFLGLKTLSLVSRTEKLIHQEEDPTFDIRSISFDDPKTYQMLGRGDSTGIFQLEGSGIRSYLCQMKPDRIEDLIVLLALYRPGPIANIPEYINCKQGKAEPTYLHPKLKPILCDTFGVMTYQEDVMEIARALAGYTMGQADMLRRAMGKKIVSEMAAHKVRFIDGCKNNGLSHKIAAQLYEDIAKFANYGFNKGHAVSYAVLSYQTAYLKSHYPVAFMASSMTLDIGRIDKINLGIQELIDHGITLLQPDINRSYCEFTIETTASGQKAIRYALIAIKGISGVAMESLIAERTKNGMFLSLSDFARRIDTRVIPKNQLEILSVVGAFDSLLDNRAQIFHAIEQIYDFAQSTTSDRTSGQVSLFSTASATITQDLILSEILDWSLIEKFKRAFDAMGVCLTASHPLEEYKESLKQHKVRTFVDLRHAIQPHQKSYVHMAGILVNQQAGYTKKGKKYLSLTLSDSSSCFDVVIFRQVWDHFQDLLVLGSIIIVAVEAHMSDDSLSLTGQDIQRFDPQESFTDHIWVMVQDEKAVLALREFVDHLREGQSRLSVVVTIEEGQSVDEHQVAIHLPGHYCISQEMQTRLHNLSGVMVMDYKKISACDERTIKRETIPKAK